MQQYRRFGLSNELADERCSDVRFAKCNIAAHPETLHMQTAGKIPKQQIKTTMSLEP
jgi:hypothetical protein